MKRIITLLLTLCLIMSMAACGQTQAGEGAAAASTASAPSGSSAPQPSVSAAPQSPQPSASAPPKTEETVPPAKEEYVPETVLSEGGELSPDVCIEISAVPRVCFLVDSEDDNRVCGVTFANEDAAKLLDAEDFLDRTFGEAYAALLAALVNEGYSESSTVEPEITFAGVTVTDGEYLTVPVEDPETADLPTVDDLHFYIDAINETLANTLENRGKFDPAAAAQEADLAKLAASVERREYTATVDPVSFNANMYSWRFSMVFENTGTSLMKLLNQHCERRSGGQTGTLVYESDRSGEEWAAKKGSPLEIAPGSAYTYDDGYPVEDKSFDYMQYAFTFVDEEWKKIEIVYHFNLTFNLPQSYIDRWPGLA